MQRKRFHYPDSETLRKRRDAAVFEYYEKRISQLIVPGRIIEEIQQGKTGHAVALSRQQIYRIIRQERHQRENLKAMA